MRTAPLAGKNGGTITRADWRLFVISSIVTAASAIIHFVSVGGVLPFVVTAGSLAVLASLVGRSVDRLGDRLGSGATGFVQSALGNLPELFVGIFALRAGLVGVVQSALIGSVLANLLLVLGLAFIAGGIRHGTQAFAAPAARTTMLLLVISVAIIAIPTVALHVGGPASHHPRALSDVASIILLAIFLLSIPATLRGMGDNTEGPALEGALWPISLVIGVLLVSSVAAALVSDWFVAALTPALHVLHMSQAFAGLVVVAIAGNAVENFVGIKLAVANRMDYALSVILQSPMQIALGLFPILVLASGVIGGAALTLVMPTLLLAVLTIGTAVGVIIVFDGESTWLEGAILVGLYATIATAFWWG
jgi:Ca2+:H+ antiporter